MAVTRGCSGLAAAALRSYRKAATPLAHFGRSSDKEDESGTTMSI
jgi:hypothetical protein